MDGLMDGRMDTGGPVRLEGVRPGVREGEGAEIVGFWSEGCWCFSHVVLRDSCPS